MVIVMCLVQELDVRNVMERELAKLGLTGFASPTDLPGWEVRDEVTYRGTSLIRKSPPAGSYSRTMARAVWWP